MAFTLPCPRGEECPLEAEECWEFTAVYDGDQPCADVLKQVCPCDLNDQEWETLLTRADERAVDYWASYEEPPF